MSKKKNPLIVGLDIGTTKICAVVGEAKENGLDIVGVGTHPSKGIRKGVVVNVESTVASIEKAVEEAELMAGCDISSVYAGIGGTHIKSINSHGVTPVKDGEVKAGDMKKVINAAQTVALPANREVIHVLPQEFIVDDHEGIKEPVGIAGKRLEVKVHLVTADVASAQNIVKCSNRTGLNVNDMVFHPLAAAEAVLDDDERELGVLLIDIGGGTTEMAVYFGNSVYHTAVLGVGGNHITNDLSVGLRTPVEEAEKLKLRYGCALTSLVQRDEEIEVPSVGGRPPRVIARQLLAEIIQPRLEEIMDMVNQEIIRSEQGKLLASGVVLTGGTACLQGIVELAEQVLQMPVRQGYARGVGGLVDVIANPSYATAVGLALFGYKKEYQPATEKIVKGFWGKVKDKISPLINTFF